MDEILKKLNQLQRDLSEVKDAVIRLSNDTANNFNTHEKRINESIQQVKKEILKEIKR